ncbi:hypothetical protein JQX13_07100 [Archangium violaceum]|uniref:hypothetical protein n=1 Tax=Archangium violaceum TaxID=83451 RepID=UPI00193B05AC|nr:hypothetical protein [Archangium violaceum]QRK09869.1 hypothetical protein JQX13_07100 [Archangium violaceum]
MPIASAVPVAEVSGIGGSRGRAWLPASVGGLLVFLSGCIDFDKELGEFCLRAPAREVSAAGDESMAPYFREAPESSSYVEGTGQLSFQVTAEDPLGCGLRFSWSASVGTLSLVQETATTSQARWTAPACLGPGETASFTATVSDVLDQSVTTRFSAVGIPDCPSWSPTCSLDELREGHTATLLTSGKVLVAGGELSNAENVSTAEVYTP